MRSRSVAALMLSVALAGCVSGQTGLALQSSAPAEAPIVEVTNQHAQDMKVYLWPKPGAARWRLGTVPAKSSAALAVPRLFWGRAVRLVLQPFASAGEEFATPEVVLDKGFVFDLRVQAVLRSSFVFER